jgi:hypothetical protein
MLAQFFTNEPAYRQCIIVPPLARYRIGFAASINRRPDLAHYYCQCRSPISRFYPLLLSSVVLLFFLVTFAVDVCAKP